MNPTRREARIARLLHGLAALLLVLAAGCSRAPKPRAAIPAADTTRAAGRNAPAPPARRAAATTPPRKEASPPAATRNGSTPTVSGAKAGSSTSTPPVVPQLTAAEQERLERESKEAFEHAQRVIEAIEVAKLDAEKHRKFLIAKDFLTQAGEARTRKEFERAQGLALKARLLAEEIAPR